MTRTKGTVENVSHKVYGGGWTSEKVGGPDVLQKLDKVRGL